MKTVIFTLFLVFYLVVLFSNATLLEFKKPKLDNRVMTSSKEKKTNFVIGMIYEATITGCHRDYKQHIAYTPESVRLAIDEINNNDRLLPNITLGFKAINHCRSPSLAVHQTMKFTPTALFGEPAPEQRSNLFPNDVVAVISYTPSSVAVTITPILAQYGLPMISPYSTSDALSDKSLYPNFMRVIPPDSFQALAMIDIMMKYDWSYFNVIVQADAYGRNAMNWLKLYARQFGICVAHGIEFPVTRYQDAGEMQFHLEIMRRKRAKVIAIFAEPWVVLDFFKLIDNKGEFIFILSETFTQSYELLTEPGVRDVLLGAFGVDIKVTRMNTIDEVTKKLTTKDFKRNPWLEKLWEEQFACEFNANINQTSCGNTVDKTLGDSGKLSYASYYTLVYESAYTAAHGLHNHIEKNCRALFDGVSQETCDGRNFYSTLVNTSYEGVSGPIRFNENGDPDGLYSISQWQLSQQAYSFIELGSWRGSRSGHEVSLEEEQIHWKYWEPAEEKIFPDSVCSYPCVAGQYKQQLDEKCCWNCKDCRQNEIVVKEGQSCNACPPLQWPEQKQRLTCEPIEPTYLDFKNPVSWALMALSVIGIVATTVIIIIFVKEHSHKFIKASSRTVCLTILAGILAGFGTVFLVIVTPSRIVCSLSFVGFAVSCSVSFSALLVKTLRVFRIFSMGQKGKMKVKYISDTAQMVFITLICSVQIIFCVVVIVLGETNSKLRQRVLHEKNVELYCHVDVPIFVVALGYNILLSLIAAIYGFKTRKVPENFNESWFIFLITCMTSFLWLIFVPSYFITPRADYQTMLFALLLLFTFYLILACLFAPKVYALYFADESKIMAKNWQTTATTVAPATEKTKVDG